jgi:glycosyltransferase involved in cell wall biosynthesis
MKIGIDASRAFLEKRTGIEEYSYRVIQNLKNDLRDHTVILYIRDGQQAIINSQQWPEKWKMKVVRWPKFWTQIGLSIEMYLRPIDVLFVPAHTVPIIHPKNTIVTIHGLEYEFCKNAYSFWARIYMRWTIKKSCQWARDIISVSENTKKDLIELYGVSEKKISVIHEGFNLQEGETKTNECLVFNKISSTKYLLFIGRIEERKNIFNIIKAFEILKEKYKITHSLVLVGKRGYGFKDIKFQINNSKYADDIVRMGFVSEEEKWKLLRNAEAFVFPTHYEGFGIPLLEAQSVGCVVVAGNNSSIPEVAGAGAVLVDEKSPEDIAEALWKLISNESSKNAILSKGLENVKRFSWKKCSKEIAEIILK